MKLTINFATLSDREARSAVALLQAYLDRAIQETERRTVQPPPAPAPTPAQPVPAPAADPAPAPAADPAPAPAADPAPAPAAPTGEVDSDGVPWDERIHSSARKFNTDGRWKKRRGVDDSDYKRITDELKFHQSVAPTQVEKESVTEQQGPDPSKIFGKGQGNPSNARPETNWTWPILLKTLLSASLPKGKLDEVLSKHGIANVAMLATRHEIWEEIVAELGIE